MGKIELALNVILQAEPVFDKVCKALNERRPFTRLDEVAQLGLEQKLISEQEAELLIEAEQHRLYTINVDDFAPQELAAKKSQPKLVEVA